MRTARGWTAEPVTSGARALHAKAGSDALLGEVSDAIPRPLPAIGQGTGGDGHVPILVGSKVFAFFHHSTPTQVTCVDRATGSLCPGYPKTLNQATTNIPGPAVVVGTRIYVHLSPMQFAAQRTAQALYCWDAAKDRTCGLIVADRLDRQYAYASAPVLIGGKLYFGGDGGSPLLRRPRHERAVRGRLAPHRPRHRTRTSTTSSATAPACISGGSTGWRRAST